jgi:hypothetical protein
MKGKNMSKLKTLFKSLLLALPVLGLLIILGCSFVQDSVTPCYINPEQIEYTGAEATSLVPYTTLADARRITAQMNYLHTETQIGFTRLQEDDIRKVNYLQERATLYQAQAEEFKSIVFDPEGPIGLLLPAGLGTLMGATLISKGSDKKKIAELEKKVNA